MKLKEIIEYAIILAVVIAIRTFVVTPIRVNGTSMNDTLADGDIMVLKKYDKNSIDRFEIVVVKTTGEKIIKRVIGLPEEEIKYENGTLYINGEEMEESFGYTDTKDFQDYCGKDEYFVMGDNRIVSKDSRIIGCIPKDNIMGTVDLIVFPFSKIGSVK